MRKVGAVRRDGNLCRRSCKKIWDGLKKKILKGELNEKDFIINGGAAYRPDWGCRVAVCANERKKERTILL